MSTSSKPALKPKPPVSIKPRHLSVSPPGKPPTKPKPPVAARKPSVSLAAKPKISTAQCQSPSLASAPKYINREDATSDEILDENLNNVSRDPGATSDDTSTDTDDSTNISTETGAGCDSSPVDPVTTVDDGDQENDVDVTVPAMDELNLRHRGDPYTAADWKSGFDADGRAGDEWKFKKAVFLGGIEPSARQEIWPFLLGVFDFKSTYREREVVTLEHRIEYLALKERWRETLTSAAVAEIELPGEELDDQQQFIFIQAKVNAMRHEINEVEAEKAIRAIAKDVPRTDRKGGYFRDDTPHRLQWLNDILVTYAVFHPTVGYAQGMNDVLSMILAVMDHEADAYWCFEKYLATIQNDFMAKGMMDKLDQLRDLVAFMDKPLHEHFVQCDAGDMVFCHRWLLLSFKREFQFHEATRLFEILCSHHLELSSVEADKARTAEVRALGTEFRDTDDTDTMPAETPSNGEEYTFELFMSVAILKAHRDVLMQMSDMAEIFTFVNNLVGKMHLDTVLSQTEDVFFEFCRRSVGHASTELQAILQSSK
eukprot:m.208165 g.208165  ORF g.208165 m.208165 type:complete len:541 (+) comp18959_c0_seq3:149-1771(+)